MLLTVAGIGVVAYLGYRWYENNYGSGAQGLGSNLGSATPVMTGGSAGPNSGLDYNAGTTVINVTEPVTSTGPNVPPPDQGTGVTVAPHPKEPKPYRKPVIRPPYKKPVNKTANRKPPLRGA